MHNILLVDDLDENLLVLEEIIDEHFSVQIHTARDGMEALEVLLHQHIDLIITDIQMPNMDGFTLVEMLKKRKSTQNIPVIFITAEYNHEDFKIKGFDLGALDYITKPIDEPVLVGKIRRYFEIFTLQYELIEQKNYLNNILDVQDTVTLLYEDSQIKFANRRFFEIFGFASLQEFQKRYTCISELFILKHDHNSLQAQVGYSWWIEYVLNNPQLVHEAYVYDMQGKERVFKVNVVMIKKQVEQRSQYLISLTDITLIKEQTKILHMHSRYKTMSEITAMIAHQWRQPLSALATIMAGLQMKRELGKLDDQKLSSSLYSCDSIISEMTSTIDKFQNFFETSKNKKYNPLKIIIESPVELLKSELKNNEVTLKIDYSGIDEKDYLIKGNMLHEVFLNLYKNSLEAFNANGYDELPQKFISIRVSKNKEEYNISVCDNAGGIDESIQESVFDAYFSTKSKNAKGLGLFMVKTVIEDRMLGKITIKNKDAGVCVDITLPADIFLEMKELNNA